MSDSPENPDWLAKGAAGVALMVAGGIVKALLDFILKVRKDQHVAKITQMKVEQKELTTILAEQRTFIESLKGHLKDQSSEIKAMRHEITEVDSLYLAREAKRDRAHEECKREVARLRAELEEHKRRCRPS